MISLLHDHNRINLSRFRSDIENLIKMSPFSNFRDEFEIAKSKGFVNFLSPNFSKFIRIFSKNSFEIVSFFQKLKYPSKKSEKIFFRNFLNLGINFFNLFFQSNFTGPRFTSKKKIKINFLFNIDNFGLDMISRTYRISFSEAEFIELFSLSKGILIETMGKYYKKCIKMFWWVLRFLLLFFKSIATFPLRYKWGVLFLFSSENFEYNEKCLFLRLFPNFDKFKNNFGKWKIGLYDEFLFFKALIYIEIFFFCSAYSRNKRVKFLLKANYMINYKMSLTGLMSAKISFQLHFSPQNFFGIKIDDKNDCLGEIMKTKHEAKILDKKFSSFKRLEIQIIRNCDFLNQKKNLNFFKNSNFFEFINQKNLNFLGVSKKKKQPFFSLKLGYSIVFFLNLALINCYSVSTSSTTLFQFFNELVFYDLINFNHFCLGLLIFFMKKEEYNFQQTKLIKICGIQFEFFLESFICKKKKNIFLNQILNLNCVCLLYTISFLQKILTNCYSIFFVAIYPKLISNYLKSKKFFYKNLFFWKDTKIIEIKIRKYTELVSFNNTSSFFFTLGNFTKKNKYFEIITKRDLSYVHLSKQFLGSWFCDKKKWIHARKQFFLSILANPKNKNVLFDLGFVSLKLKDFQTALRSFLKIIQEEPWNKFAWNNLSSVVFSNFKKKEICFTFLKETMKTKNFPVFIFKNFFIFCLNPKKLKLMNLMESFKNFLQKNYLKKFNFSNLYLKILLNMIEIFSKKFILFLGEKIKSFFFLKVFWDFVGLEYLIFRFIFCLIKQNGNLKNYINHFKKILNPKIILTNNKQKLILKYYKESNEIIEKITNLLFFL